MNLFSWLYRSLAFESNPKQSVQKIAPSMSVGIAQGRVAPNGGCNNPFDPESLGSDLNTVIRTGCMFSVKCAEATWNYKSGTHSAL